MGDDYVARIRSGSVWVAGDPEDGVVVLLDAPGHLLLDNVAVDRDAQGKGIGRMLIAFAEAEARRRGHAELRLHTHQLMTENIALYARTGWEETGRGEQVGFARVFFRKRLST